MLNDKTGAHLKMHLIVFIWGFTAVLGDLISIQEYRLVWFRMGLATVFLYLWQRSRKVNLAISRALLLKTAGVGLLIALHWIFFFKAIKISNVSITLAVFSTGSFFAALLEPFFFKRKMLWYEVFFGLIIVAGLSFIIQVEVQYLEGAICALFSLIMGVLFTLCNGKLTRNNPASILTVYEFFAGFLAVSVYLLATGEVTAELLQLSGSDWFYLLILASICTAYAFTASVDIMKKLSPYTVMLTTNLEPVYGIFLAYFILGDSEQMSLGFYIGAAVILATVLLNGYIKSRSRVSS